MSQREEGARARAQTQSSSKTQPKRHLMLSSAIVPGKHHYVRDTYTDICLLSDPCEETDAHFLVRDSYEDTLIQCQ